MICQTTPGTYYYHGERLRDGANVDAFGMDGVVDLTDWGASSQTSAIAFTRDGRILIAGFRDGGGLSVVRIWP